MADTPLRLKDGTLGCPDCKTSLQSRKSPFNFHGEYVGHFESYVCSICNFHLFTSKGYDNAIKTAKSFGMIGLSELEIDDLIEESFTVYNPSSDANVGVDRLSYDKDEQSISGYNQNEELVIIIKPVTVLSKIRLINY